MKTADTVFLNRLLKTEGEAPRILLEIQCGYPNESTTLYCSTERLEIENYEFKEYILSFGSLTSSIGEQDFIASPNTFSFTMVRNADTEKLLGAYQKNKQVIVRQWFKSLTVYYSQALLLGAFIIDTISNITLSSFSVNCKSDESKIAIDFPSKVLNKDDYPQLPNENEDVIRPCVLGKMWYPYGTLESQFKYIKTYALDCAPAFCVDASTYKFLIHRANGLRADEQDAISVNNTIGGQQTDGRAYQFLSSNSLFAEIIKYDVVHDIAKKEWSIKLRKPNQDGEGHWRRIRLLPDKEWTGGGGSGYGYANNCPDWYNAKDLDVNTYATIDSTHNKLRLCFDPSKMNWLGIYKPSWSNFYLRLRAGCCVTAANGISKFQLGTSFVTGTNWNLAPGNNIFELEQSTWFTVDIPMSADGWRILYIYAEHTGNNPLRVNSLYLIADFWDNTYKEQ
jgi:hypothetical protein